MELTTYILKLVFFFFLIYTFVFILQWVMGLFFSSTRLSSYREKNRTISLVLPNELARKYSVSVIVPAYNEEDCISSTIDSLLEDDYPNLNIIVVDDGSKDSTSQRVIDDFKLLPKELEVEKTLETKDIKAIYERVIGTKILTLVTKENGGKADSLNCGLNLCKSDYCVIVDADTNIEKGSIRKMVARFLKDKRTIVCAGVISNSLYGTEKYNSLSFFQKALVLFQQLEYYRTFYMQRILFDSMNANVVVSGAFAMFNANLVKAVGGYKVDTIGEDMELTMRLHAYCHAQKKKYRIAYAPEVRCTTQVPFTYKDFYQQRRRWHIGMLQSLKSHKYMLGKFFYGGAGIISGTFIIVYELFAPVIELLGFLTFILAWALKILNTEFSVAIIFIYAFFALFTQIVLIFSLTTYGVEKISIKEKLWIVVVALAEPIFFHPLNMLIKLQATFLSKKNAKTWEHIQRATD